MLGRDAHIINNLSNHVLPSFMLILVFHCLPRYQERVHLWNHEPRSIFNHKKHLSNNFYPLYIFCHLKIRKYKNTFTSCIHNTKPKNIIHHCFHHPCIFIYHHCIFIYCFAFIIFSYHSHTLCLTTTWWGWGHKTIYFVAGSQEKDKEITPEILVPREFDIKPSSHPSWGKLSSTTTYTLHLEF